MQIKPLTENYFDEVILLANLVHGDNYLDMDGLLDMIRKGTKSGLNACFVAVDDNDKIIGFRTTYAATQWSIDKWCTPDKWPVNNDLMAYFKCSAIAPEAQGQGIGPKLLEASIDVLKQQGAKAGLAHLWMQSPGNAAVKYFTKAGGVLINTHHDRWLPLCLEDGYVCTICGNECHCQAAEMAIIFEQKQ
ncbi:GNAT family N-acetyltransferase [Pseudoalteromonas xiamenensis]|uniref:GNAT family N-acetyltransferase n=1 Tax=Pseudoalteromonas xiamenensis TaxID=882626 RepID=A0A975DKI7_9GAMM|nr:GNAT family N-acetyltransferase [Pseudoalteromonas xiamenensis]QTH73425.1 GNAT family N-acetyltransferase [Pseudoalteromonas xiamenensis]